ncbi:MAG: hypothetical protein ABJM36_16260 [Algibacter sp.]|uniref:hypothetical protein n=1 Tax=Algibacter sp. TaxID=1872428 RepID=UPI00329885E7
MTIANYSNFKTFKFTKLEMPFGNFFICDKFCVGEIHEGVHYDWDKLFEVMEILQDFYSKDTQFAYISNRINHYSTDPSNWTKVEKSSYNLIASAIVIYNNSTYMNASIEKQFTNLSIKRCMSLEQAIDWILNLNEFN